MKSPHTHTRTHTWTYTQTHTWTRAHLHTLRCDSKIIGFIRGKGERKKCMVKGMEGGMRKRMSGGQGIAKYWLRNQDMVREELCSMKIYQREKPRQHKQPRKSWHGGGREHRANECREVNCCQYGELRWRMGRAQGWGEGEMEHFSSLWWNVVSSLSCHNKQPLYVTEIMIHESSLNDLYEKFPLIGRHL